MPTIVYDIINILGSGLRLIGMAAFGVSFGWLAVDLLRKAQAWQMQAIVFLGLAGLAIAMSVFLAWGALGAFGIGVAVALFVWGMPKKKKDEDK
jgi:NhaP-type Na+/H+ or K+/H+ antiporter